MVAMHSAFYTDDLSDTHTLPGHPEHAGRLQAVRKLLKSTGLENKLHRIDPVSIDISDLERVHTSAYLKQLDRASAMGEVVLLEADTYFTPESYEIAKRGVGAGFAIAKSIAEGTADNGLLAVRPPGHHATPQRVMGFCLLNNVALITRYLQSHFEEINKVAIVDFDVHHGNGTQDTFYDDESVLFISSHQMPLYPGSGSASEMGKNTGYGYTLNLPLSHAMGDDAITEVYESLVVEALHNFQPDFIIVSAGFDSHWRDPLAQLNVSLQGLATLTRLLISQAKTLCNGKILFSMEGGYDLEVLANGVANIAYALIDQDDISDPIGEPRNQNPLSKNYIERARERHPLLGK